MKECLYCTFENDDDSTVCENCGATLAKIFNPTRTKLSFYNPANRDLITTINGGVFGREGDITSPSLQEDKTISRYHLEVENNGDCWNITHIGKNKPKLNGISLDTGIKAKLNHNDYLNIGNQLYKIRLEEIKSHFVIICPCCNHKYSVDSLDSRIQICVYCDDKDKHKISKEKAVEVFGSED